MYKSNILTCTNGLVLAIREPKIVVKVTENPVKNKIHWEKNHFIFKKCGVPYFNYCKDFIDIAKS